MADPLRSVRRLLSARPTALLAVAEPTLRSRLAAALADVPCEVIAVADGYHLIERIADAILEDLPSARPNLIVVEAILPGCTGLSLLAGIRELGWETPTILLSRRQDERWRGQAWEHRVTGVFIEPFDLQELCAFAKLVLDPGICAAIQAARAPRTRPSPGPAPPH